MSYEKLTKISGYLEKRGKLSLMGRWKKWWCVLEGQLLLYYKSRIEYTNLSPCCGSLNMALVKNVQPHVGFQIHILTHSQLIILRTKNKEKQQQWFHALVGVLPQNSHLLPILCFSTSSIEYRRKSDRKKKKSKHKDEVFKESIKVTDESSSFSKSENDIPNPTNELQFDIFENHTVTEIQNISSSQERIQIHQSRISTSLECNLQQQNTCARNSMRCGSEVNIRRYSSYQSVINGVFINDRMMIPNRRSISCECVFTHCRTSSIEQYNFQSSGSIRSDERSRHINQHVDDKDDECKQYKRRGRKKHRSDSKKYDTLSKKSLSFLRKIFKKKSENQIQAPDENPSSKVVEENQSRLTAPENVEVNISESSESDTNKPNTIQTIENDDTARIEIEEIITPCDDSVEKYIANTSSNNETESESSDAESGIVATENSQEDGLPDLPMKNGNCSFYPYQNFKDVNSNYPATLTRNHPDAKNSISIDNCTSIELDSLLLQLTALNTQRDKSHESLEFHNNIIEDPDYDIPRPHTSLISDTGNISSTQEKNCSDFVRNDDLRNHRYDSLSLDMAPDSLEMPWLLTDTECNINYWTTKKEFDHLCLENDSGSEYDYHDSLNSNKYNS